MEMLLYFSMSDFYLNFNRLKLDEFSDFFLDGKRSRYIFWLAAALWNMTKHACCRHNDARRIIKLICPYFVISQRSVARAPPSTPIRERCLFGVRDVFHNASATACFNNQPAQVVRWRHKENYIRLFGRPVP